MTNVPTNEPQADDDQSQETTDPAVADPTDAAGGSDAGPGPDDPAAAADSPEMGTEVPQSYDVGQVVTMPGRQDAEGNEGPRRVAIVVGVEDTENGAVYDVARLPDATDRLFAGDLQPA